MYAEVNLLGVYVAPFVVMMLIAWIVMIPIGIASNRMGLSRHVWHPGLFNLCLYVIVLSLIVIFWGAHP